MARLNLMETIQTGKVGAPNSNLVYAEAPSWFQNWEKTGLLKFEDKNGDGQIQYYGDSGIAKAQAALAKAKGAETPDAEAIAKAKKSVTDAQAKHAKTKFAGYGWKGNEMVKVDRDIMVLANPEIANLPNWVIALVAAGGIAAALSTAAGLLLAIAAAISHDLLKGIFTPNIDEKQELLASRIAMGGAIIVAGLLGMHPPGFAAQVVALAFGLAASSIFPALMLGIFVKRMNSTGAICGMLAGLGSTLLYIFWFKGFFFIPEWRMAADNANNWLLGISPGSFGAVGAMINFAVALTVCKFTEPPPEHIQHLVEDIRVPASSGSASDH
jgi:cation/acetate symporter